MKKFLSMAIALVMVLSLSVVAFADTTVATQDITASGILTVLDGLDLTDETLTLEVYFEVTDSSKIGYGPMALCDSNWVSAMGYSTDYDIFQVNEDGVISVPLTTIAEAFEAAGLSTDSIVLNWWADSQSYANLTGVAVVSSSDDAVEADPEEVGETEEADASEETTETVEETTSEEASSTSPATGVALALVPMAIAGIAVVSTKRR